MPTYDYNCSKCGHTFETFHTMSITLKECPQCKKMTLERGCGGGFSVRVKKDKSFYKKQEIKERKKHRKNMTNELKEKYKDKKPWWRDEQVDMGVLKNPKKYIQTGEK